MFVYIPTMATEMVEAQKKMDKTLLVFIKFKFFNPFDYLEVIFLSVTIHCIHVILQLLHSLPATYLRKFYILPLIYFPELEEIRLSLHRPLTSLKQMNGNIKMEYYGNIAAYLLSQSFPLKPSHKHL